MSILLERTRGKGLPALWESGGGSTNTGYAQVVAGPHGEPLKPVYVRRRGHLSCAHHALFVVEPKVWLIRADHHREDFEIGVFQLGEISPAKQTEGFEAEVVDYFRFEMGEWDREPPKFLEAAIEAAKDKATCYHCREPHFMSEDRGK